MKIIIISVILLIGMITAIPYPGADDDEGFLPGSSCNDASDCYIFDDTNKGLQLACWYNVHQCKCQNTIRSDHHLLFKDGKCRMSKFGPCGKKVNSTLEVDCLDGFKCVENQCRDPGNTDASAAKSGPFIFNKQCSDGCQFSEDLNLDCDRAGDKCACRKVEIADARGTSWDIRSYDGDRKCSVGKFGPCGKKDGIEIECHGAGISCVDGTCLDPSHPISGVNEACESKKNCKEGLLCSSDNICIEPKTLDSGKSCVSDEECKEGLKCGRRPGTSPWDYSRCGTEAEFTAEAPHS